MSTDRLEAHPQPHRRRVGPAAGAAPRGEPDRRSGRVQGAVKRSAWSIAPAAPRHSGPGRGGSAARRRRPRSTRRGAGDPSAGGRSRPIRRSTAGRRRAGGRRRARSRCRSRGRRRSRDDRRSTRPALDRHVRRHRIRPPVGLAGVRESHRDLARPVRRRPRTGSRSARRRTPCRSPGGRGRRARSRRRSAPSSWPPAGGRRAGSTALSAGNTGHPPTSASAGRRCRGGRGAARSADAARGQDGSAATGSRAGDEAAGRAFSTMRGRPRPHGDCCALAGEIHHARCECRRVANLRRRPAGPPARPAARDGSGDDEHPAGQHRENGLGDLADVVAVDLQRQRPLVGGADAQRGQAGKPRTWRWPTRRARLDSARQVIVGMSIGLARLQHDARQVAAVERRRPRPCAPADRRSTCRARRSGRSRSRRRPARRRGRPRGAAGGSCSGDENVCVAVQA